MVSLRHTYADDENLVKGGLLSELLLNTSLMLATRPGALCDVASGYEGVIQLSEYKAQREANFTCCYREILSVSHCYSPKLWLSTDLVHGSADTASGCGGGLWPVWLKDQPSRAIAVVAICFGIFKTVQLMPACMLQLCATKNLHNSETLLNR